jgi:hypothetical protein
VAAEVAIPLLNRLGNGWLYTGWGFVLALAEVSLLLVIWKGKEWRERAVKEEEGSAGDGANKG